MAEKDIFDILLCTTTKSTIIFITWLDLRIPNYLCVPSSIWIQIQEQKFKTFDESVLSIFAHIFIYIYFTNLRKNFTQKKVI